MYASFYPPYLGQCPYAFKVPCSYEAKGLRQEDVYVP